MPKRKRTTRKAMEGWAATREPRGVIEQAAADRKRGIDNTDCRVRDASSSDDCPRPSPRARRGAKKAR
jgi:hypothetical protein